MKDIIYLFPLKSNDSRSVRVCVSNGVSHNFVPAYELVERDLRNVIYLQTHRKLISFMVDLQMKHWLRILIWRILLLTLSSQAISAPLRFPVGRESTSLLFCPQSLSNHPSFIPSSHIVKTASRSLFWQILRLVAIRWYIP